MAEVVAKVGDKDDQTVGDSASKVIPIGEFVTIIARRS